MEEDANEDTEHLIADSTKKQPKGPSCMQKRTIVVEPLLILYIAAGLPLMNIRSQFMYQKVAESMGINFSNTTSNRSDCNESLTDPDFIAKQAVQGETATLNMYISLASFLPSFIALLAYGAVGDRIGRKLLLILPCIGSLFETFLYMSIIKFDLSVYFFFLEPVQYVFGGMESLMLGLFAYISDTIPPERRSFRMTVLDVVGLANAAIASLITGYWIKAQGFFWPLVFVAGGKGLALLYAVFFIPETVHNEYNINDRPSRKMSLKDIFSGLRLMFKDDGTDRRSKINLLVLAFTVGSLVQAHTITTLFEMNNPLCWGPVLIGYFSSSSLLAKCLTMLFAAWVLKKWLDDKWLVIISKISIVIENIFLVFVTSTVMMFLVPVLGCVSFLSIPMTRALLSTHAGQNEQASVFSLLGISMAFTNLVSSVATNKIYSASLMFMVGMVFLVDAVLNIISTGIFGYYIYKINKENTKRSTVNIQE